MRPLLLSLVIISLAAPAHGAEPESETARRLQGCWRGLEGAQGTLVRFEPTRCLIHEKGRLQAFAAKYDNGRLLLRSLGHQVVWQLELRGDVLVMAMGDNAKPLAFRKIDGTPAVLELKPLVLGKPKELTPERVKAIQQDLAQRLKIDQEVRLDPAKQPMMAQVDADNTAHVIKLVQELGWIDVPRFGPAAANAAFLITQHSGNLPLMMAAQPAIEQDFQAKRIEGQAFALLTDRLHALLGEKQRYGTQIAQNEKGEWVVLAMQEPAKVEQLRKQVGLLPLPEYLEVFKKANNVKGEIKFEEK